MAAAEDVDPPAGKPKRSRLPLILGLALALAGGGGGFYAAYSGLLPGLLASGEEATAEAAPPPPLGPVEFVQMEPLLISLGGAAGGRHLRFRAHLEVAPGTSGDVQALMPRILDVANSYLRAVSVEELEGPSALIRIRAQMLRRMQLVVGDGRVRDLLVTEFVLS
jgi:flagellar FliL protein